jgi:hypothetical protein
MDIPEFDVVHSEVLKAEAYREPVKRVMVESYGD